jgi:hypothetical protein
MEQLSRSETWPQHGEVELDSRSISVDADAPSWGVMRETAAGETTGSGERASMRGAAADRVRAAPSLASLDAGSRDLPSEWRGLREVTGPANAEAAIRSADRLAALICEQRSLLEKILGSPIQGDDDRKPRASVEKSEPSLATVSLPESSRLHDGTFGSETEGSQSGRSASSDSIRESAAEDDELPPIIIMRAQAATGSMLLGDAQAAAQSPPFWPGFTLGFALAVVAGWAAFVLLNSPS